MSFTCYAFFVTHFIPSLRTLVTQILLRILGASGEVHHTTALTPFGGNMVIYQLTTHLLQYYDAFLHKYNTNKGITSTILFTLA